MLPRGAIVSSATRLAIPHVGTQSAASLPSRPAIRSCSSLTDGSSPTVAQPSFADRIASHISSVGGASASERRSTGHCWRRR